MRLPFLLSKLHLRTHSSARLCSRTKPGPTFCLLLAALMLGAVLPGHAEPSLAKWFEAPPSAELDKEFPFDPGDKRSLQGLGQAYAMPVHGRMGLVISPYAPDAGYVDVRGYKFSQEARCPYTGKIFLVP